MVLVLDWSNADQEKALREGWGVFDNSDHGERIERYDDAQRFDCDAAAQAFVAVRAIFGDPLARRAVIHLAYRHAVLDTAEE